jgi:hypothetical protein
MVQVIVDATTRRVAMAMSEASMALVLGLAVGDVVDIADYWIAVLSVDSRKSARLIAKGGEKIAISSKYETELVPGVWIQLGPWKSKTEVKLLIEAPTSISITRRQSEKTSRSSH